MTTKMKATSRLSKTFTTDPTGFFRARYSHSSFNYGPKNRLTPGATSTTSPPSSPTASSTYSPITCSYPPSMTSPTKTSRRCCSSWVPIVPTIPIVSNLVELISYVYVNTDSLISEEEPLCELVTTCLARHFRYFKGEEVGELMEQGGDFVQDFWGKKKKSEAS